MCSPSDSAADVTYDEKRSLQVLGDQNDGDDLTLEEVEEILRNFKNSHLPYLYYRRGNSFVELGRKTTKEPQVSEGGVSVPVSSEHGSQTFNINLAPPPSYLEDSPNPSVEYTSDTRTPAEGDTIRKEPEMKDTGMETTTSAERDNSQSEKRHSAANETDVAIIARRVGRFRRGRSRKKPLVEVGDHVSLKQPICVIEQLGLQHVYFAEVEGVVSELLVQDGDPVEYGQKTNDNIYQSLAFE
eukprot:jgi/Galph1/757/GphlegSOOS_G5513.1